MKKKSNHHFERTSNEVIEANFQEALEDTEDMVIQLAIDNATFNKPGLEEPAHLYIEQIPNACNQIAREKIHAQLQPEHNQRRLEKAEQSNGEAIAKLKTQQSDKEHDQKVTGRELEKNQKKCAYARTKIKLWTFFAIVVMGITGGDIILSSSALQQMGFNLISSILLGTAIAICALFLADTLPAVLQSKKISKKRKTFFAVALIGFLSIIFAVLGKYRSLSLEGQYAGSHWIYFLLINLLFLAASAIIVWRYKPNKEDQRLVKLWKNIKKKSKVLDKEIKGIKDEIAEFEKALEEAQNAYDAVISFGEMLEGRLVTAYKNFIHLYMRENLFRRKDGITPKFFLDYTAPQLHLFFTQNKNHEV